MRFLIKKLLKENLYSKQENCEDIPLNSKIIDYIKKFNSDEELLRKGGLPIEMLDELAFGFSENDIKTINPENLKIRWKDDLENVKYEIQKSGLTPKKWAEKINLSEPIDVDFWEDKKNNFKIGFYVQDGHHRYMAAKILKKPLKVNLEIKVNPITKLSNLGYDDFHRCLFKTIKKK